MRTDETKYFYYNGYDVNNLLPDMKRNGYGLHTKTGEGGYGVNAINFVRENPAKVRFEGSTGVTKLGTLIETSGTEIQVACSGTNVDPSFNVQPKDLGSRIWLQAQLVDRRQSAVDERRTGSDSWKLQPGSGLLDNQCQRDRQSVAVRGNGRAILSLGNVPSGVAHVFVNGIDCGSVWCAPWEADVSAAVKDGSNEIEIRYVNNWENRLIGDARVPEPKRVTRHGLRTWKEDRYDLGTAPGASWLRRPTVYSGYSAHDPLQSCGLLGPIVLKGRSPAE